MTAWLQSLTTFQTVLLYIAAPSLVLLIIQFILLLVGFGDQCDYTGDVGGVDIDGDGMTDIPDADAVNAAHISDVGELKLFTLRSVLAFLAVGGFAGIAAQGCGAGVWLSSAIALVSGAMAGFLVAYALHKAMMLQSSGNISLKNAVGKAGSVYIPIEGARGSRGKITLNLQGRFTEIDAVTDGQRLPTGTEVKVIELLDDSTVVVSPLAVKASSSSACMNKSEEESCGA